MLNMSLQDSRAWTLYCLTARNPDAIYTSWEQVPAGIKIRYRIKATTAMLLALAPHRHP